MSADANSTGLHDLYNLILIDTVCKSNISHLHTQVGIKCETESNTLEQSHGLVTIIKQKYVFCSQALAHFTLGSLNPSQTTDFIPF